jgi:hypothetical protein
MSASTRRAYAAQLRAEAAALRDRAAEIERVAALEDCVADREALPPSAAFGAEPPGPCEGCDALDWGRA